MERSMQPNGGSAGESSTWHAASFSDTALVTNGV